MLSCIDKKYHSMVFAFITALVISLCVYGFELTHFALSIDEEFNDNILHTISMGRWGHAFLKSTIFSEPFIPFYTTLISLFFISISSAVIAGAMKLDTKEAILDRKSV